MDTALGKIPLSRASSRFGCAGVEAFLTHLTVASKLRIGAGNGYFPRDRSAGPPPVDGPIRHHQHEKILQRAVQTVRTTMIYTHVTGKGAFGVKSPLDR